MSDLEVYCEDAGGAYLPGRGTDRWHVYIPATDSWYELYDFGPQRAVSTVPYSHTANREALGRRCAAHELPPRIGARIAELAGEGEP